MDILWVGQFDLTHSMGVAGEFERTEFVEALKKVVAVAREHGLTAAIQPRTAEQAESWSRLGFNA